MSEPIGSSTRLEHFDEPVSATDFADQDPSLYSSDLLRASETAEEVSRQLGVQITFDATLRERNNGEAKGKTKAWARENAAPRPARGAGLDRRPFAGAETPREFYERVGVCLDRILSRSEGPALLVTHGGVVHAAIAWWLGMSAELYDLTSFVTRARSSTGLGTDDWRRRALLSLGDLSHLDEFTMRK